MEKTKFSIIICVYNTRKDYLNDCFASVLNQNYDNFETIVIDDGSNKETSEYLNTYEDKFEIIHQTNKGLVKSRLVGLKKATGEYIVFLDSDDILASYSLKAFDEIIQKYNTDVIIQDPVRFAGSINNNLSKNKYFDDGIVTKEEALKQLCMLHINSINNKFVKKELYDGIEENIDSGIINGEDLQQSTYILLKANSFYCIEKNIYYYRMNIGHREYYDPSNIYDINFLLPTYKMIFIDHKGEYDDLLGTFKKSAVNSVIYNSFRVCTMNAPYSRKNEILDNINNLEIVNILKNLKVNMPFISSILFFLLTHKLYFLLKLSSYLYKLVFGIENI